MKDSLIIYVQQGCSIGIYLSSWQCVNLLFSATQQVSETHEFDHDHVVNREITTVK